MCTRHPDVVSFAIPIYSIFVEFLHVLVLHVYTIIIPVHVHNAGPPMVYTVLPYCVIDQRVWSRITTNVLHPTSCIYVPR